jgi:hypothetical protein
MQELQPIRSPTYPNMSLADAISRVRKIEKQYRTSQVDREVGAKIIGYSSLSGPANKALAALASYGLVERAGKGEMRVTERARAILHPDNDVELRQHLAAAAMEPTLFRELRERWPNMIPPEDGVVMYLNRKGFNENAIRPAAKAYLQTLLFLEEAGASDSHGAEQEPDSNTPQGDPSGVRDNTGNPPAPPPPPPPPPPSAGYGVRVMEGERVIFSEELSADQYLKLVASGDMSEDLLEALEDFIKRQRKRLNA